MSTEPESELGSEDEVLGEDEVSVASMEADENVDKPPLDLDIRIESPSACERHVTVTIAREDVDRYFDDAVGELMPKASVPGFRPGRAPRRLVESRFRDEVTDQIKGSLLLDSMTQITESEKLSAISEPDFDIDAVEVPKEGPMTFEFDIEVRPEFDMPDWKGLVIEKPMREFTDDDVRTQLTQALSRYGMLTPHDGPVEEGDHVVVDLTFRYEGEVVSEASEQTIQVLPTVSFRDGNLKAFDKLMLGAKEGDTKESTILVSEDSPNDELRGKEVEASLQVLEVKRLELPELDDAFLTRIGGFQSEGDLLDVVRTDLERQLAYHQNQQIRQQITATLTESADWELPPDMLKRQAQRELDRAIMELRSSGFTDEQIRAQTNILRQNSQEVTATALKEHFILEKIAEDEEIDAEPADYDMEISLIAAQSDESPRSVRARIEKRGLMDALRNQIIERKAVELIKSQATFTEIPYQQNRNETFAVDISIGGGQDTEIPEAKFGEAKELQQPSEHS